MKPVNIFFKKGIWLLLTILFLSTINVSAQDKDEIAAAVKKVVETRNFIFTPTSAIPISGSLRQLPMGYELEINGDSLTADLPYFGNGYAAPSDVAQISIKFTTTEFDYQATPRKKGSWKVMVKMKGSLDVRQLYFDITSSGNATLQIVSGNRQPISYNGYITEAKK